MNRKSTPRRLTLEALEGRSLMAVQGVASEAAFIVSVASHAANEYVRADDLMARRAGARAAAAHDIGAYQDRPVAEARARRLQKLP